MTLAEIREEYERHLAVSALSGASREVSEGTAQRALLAFLRAHLRPRCTLLWYGEPWLLERFEGGDLIFHRPRAMIRLGVFLTALRRGGVRDDPASVT